MYRFFAYAVLGLLLVNASLMAQTCRNTIEATAPDSRYQIHNDGTVTDLTTGLLWKRCAEGQNWNNGACSGDASAHTWQQALQLATQHHFADRSDWRLPNKNELASLLEERCVDPAINTAAFPAAPAFVFWSSSPDADLTNYAWLVGFNDGYVDVGLRGGAYAVRLVRGGQAFDFFVSGEGNNDPASSLQFPFDSTYEWTICQGYNTSELDHVNGNGGTGVYSLDFAMDPNPARGTFGCTLDGSSTGKPIYSPGKGAVRVSATGNGEFFCITLDQPVGEVKSINIGHLAAVQLDANGKPKWQTGDAVNVGQQIGVLGQPSKKEWGLAHIHMSLWNGANCEVNGENVPYDNTFGYDLPALWDQNGALREHQYYNTTIRSSVPPAASAGDNAIYDSAAQTLTIQDVQVQKDHYQVALQYQGNNLFNLKDAVGLPAQQHNQPAQYDTSTLNLLISRVQAFGTYFKLTFKNLGNYVFKIDTLEESN